GAASPGPSTGSPGARGAAPEPWRSARRAALHEAVGVSEPDGDPTRAHAAPAPTLGTGTAQTAAAAPAPGPPHTSTVSQLDRAEHASAIAVSRLDGSAPLHTSA